MLCKYLSIRPVSNPIFAGYTQYHGSTYCKDELLCVSKDMLNFHFSVFLTVRAYLKITVLIELVMLISDPLEFISLTV